MKKPLVVFIIKTIVSFFTSGRAHLDCRMGKEAHIVSEVENEMGTSFRNQDMT